MPAYDLATTAFAAGAPRKWLDNLTSHHDLPGVQSRKRGVSREFSFDAVVLVSLIRALTDDLCLPVWRAVDIAVAMSGDSQGTLVLPGGVSVRIDTADLARRAQQRLLEAAESVPRIRRGRPTGAAPPAGF